MRLPRRPESRLAAAVVPAGLVLDLLVWGGDGSGRWGVELAPGVVVVLTTAAFAALLVRRQHPVLAYAVAWTHAVTFAAVLPSYQPAVGVLIALYPFARHRPLPQALRALALTTVPFGLAVVDTVTNTGTGFFGAALTVLLWCVVVGAVWLGGRFARRAELTAALQRDNLAMEAELALGAQRVLLARDLHDVVSNAVTLIVLQAAGARRLPDGDPRLVTALQTIETTGSDAMRDLRRMLQVLSPEASGPVPPAPLGLTAVPLLLPRFAAAGVVVDLDVGGTPPLPPDLDHVAYRVVLEGLTNTAKHAGAGTSCRVSVRLVDGTLEVSVVDDGRGSRPSRRSAGGSGLGLTGLREQVTSVGGRLDAGPLPQGGFGVTATLPVPARAADAAPQPATAP